jgi:hypothetical protein
VRHEAPRAAGVVEVGEACSVVSVTGSGVVGELTCVVAELERVVEVAECDALLHALAGMTKMAATAETILGTAQRGDPTLNMTRSSPQRAPQPSPLIMPARRSLCERQPGPRRWSMCDDCGGEALDGDEPAP